MTAASEQVTLTDLFSSSVSTASSQAYVNHLTTLDLPTLLSEPTVLQTQSHHLTSSLTSLTHTAYPAFISLHDTTSALTSSLREFSSSLDALIDDSLPALEQSCTTWKERTDGVLSERRKARVVLEQHDKIRDLLDIPLLIDTCARNGYFAEALSLSAHAKAIAASQSAPSLILTSVLAEVHNSMNQMLVSLLATLHEPNRKLPALWKAVSFLRKMEVFRPLGNDAIHPEEEIALAFLSGRELCITASLEGCKRDIMRLISASASAVLSERDQEDLLRYLKKYIDLWREGVYDIVTQYSTIFLEQREFSQTGSKTSSATAPSIPSSLQTTLRTLLTTYISHALNVHLLHLLSQDSSSSYPTQPSPLTLIPLPSLPSLLTQLTYCATAFARVGVDFRSSVAQIFEHSVLQIVKDDIQREKGKFVGVINEKSTRATDPKNNRRVSGLTKATSGPVTALPSTWLLATSANSSSPPLPTSPSSSSSSAHIPPSILVSYPPLARHANVVLTTLNDLRLCAPVGIQEQLQSEMDRVLAEEGDVFCGYIKRVYESEMEKSRKENTNGQAIGDSNGSALTFTQEAAIAIAAGRVFFDSWVPFVRRALGEGVFGLKADYSNSVLLASLAEDEERGESKDEGDADGGDSKRTSANALARMLREWEAWAKSVIS